MNATREIMWNLNTLPNVIGLYGLLLVSVFIGLNGVVRRSELWWSGRPAPEYTGSWLSRLDDLIQCGLLQKKVVRGKSGTAVAHLLVYLGFLVLTFTTTMVFIHHDLGIRIYQGNFYLWVTVFSDVFGVLLLGGVLFFGYRRHIAQADGAHFSRNEDYILAMLALMVVQGYVLEGLRVYVTNDPWALYSPVGWLVAQGAWFLSADQARSIHFITWWFHTLTVYAFIALFPYTKFFHILSSPLNLFFSRTARPKGALPFIGDIQSMMESGEEFSLGLGTIKDYTWKNLLDLDACTQCGRCQDVCPAYLSGKPLSPKWMILDTRNHAYALHAEGKFGDSKLPAPAVKLDQALSSDVLLPFNAVRHEDDRFVANGTYRARNPLVQEAVRTLGGSADAKISGDVIDPNVFWTCNTCMACVEACPVGINHVDQIVGNRRHMTMMEGQIPHEAQATLRSLESRGNPYGPAEDRVVWLKGLDVKMLQPGDSVDYLYWVGCVSAYDPRKQKIAKSLVSIMQKAGLSFGVLGTLEGCTGDPARRLGEENLFQTMAKQNIELLKSVSFKVLVANCPHCFNTIKNEYPQFGNLGEGRTPEIIHHSQLLKQLIAEDKLPIKEGALQDVTFHDPCYLGRYNDEYEAPRQGLRAIKGLRIIEMERSREKGLCCGAGGGHFWMDLKIGERVNSIRAQEAADTGAQTVATACPFCMQMMEDGVKINNNETKLDVRDIAEVIAERL
ncbi:MAG: heterodisulfide reductase-related iron-sulfur binding cluster [Pseudomonadota bacterium]|jgi:Fe-S oxidoreductase/nitrate reductase gamma subunit